MSPGTSGSLRQDDLVVGYDGSGASADALALAVPLARLWNVGVQVVTIHTPVVLGGRRAEAGRARAAQRCAEDGARRLDGVRVSCTEQRAGEITAGLHTAAVGSAGLVVGRSHRRALRRRSRHGVLEDAPGPVAIAARNLRARPRLRHVVLTLPEAEPREGSRHGGAFEALLAFAERCLRHADVRVTLCALTSEPGSVRDALAAAAFQLGGTVERPVQTRVVAPHEAQWTWVDDELLVSLGRPLGAYGHLASDRTERTLLAGDSPSLLILPSPVAGTATSADAVPEIP